MSTATLSSPESVAATDVEAPPLDTSELESVGAGRVLKRLSENCVAIKIECHAVSQECQVKEAEVKIDGDKPPDGSLRPPSWKLVPNDIRQVTQNIANRARRLPGAYGTPFPGGAYIVPIMAGQSRRPAGELFGQIRGLRDQLRTTVEGFRSRWEAWLVEKREASTPAQWRQIERHLVNADVFVRKHSISAMIFPMGGGGLPANFSQTVEDRLQRLITDPSVSSADYAAVMRLLPRLLGIVNEVATAPSNILSEQNAEAWVVEARQATNRAIAESVQQMIQEPLTEFAEALATMEGIIRRGSNVQSATIDNIRRAHAKLTGFSFLLTPELTQRLVGISNHLHQLTPQAVNGRANQQNASALADFLRDAAQEMVAEDTHLQAYGQFMRGLDL